MAISNFSPEDFAGRIQILLNNEEALERHGLSAESAAPIAKNTNFLFLIHADTGEYAIPSRAGNDITRYINGELTVTSSSLAGYDEATSSASIETRLELIVPMFSKQKSNNSLLNAVRLHISEALRYADKTYVEIEEGQTYLQLVTFDFAATGSRAQLPGVGDAIGLSLYITFSYVFTGISSESVKLFLNPVNEDDDGTLIPYAKLGIARKLTSESNVQSGSNVTVPISKSLPVSSVLTINLDALARLAAFDTVAREYRLNGTIETLKIRIVEFAGFDNVGSEIYKKKDFDMVLDLATLNAEQNAVCSATYTLVETLVERSAQNG